jgi:hypothetical protein
VNVGNWVVDGRSEGADVQIVPRGHPQVVILSSGRGMILRDIRHGGYFGEFSASGRQLANGQFAGDARRFAAQRVDDDEMRMDVRTGAADARVLVVDQGAGQKPQILYHARENLVVGRSIDRERKLPVRCERVPPSHVLLGPHEPLVRSSEKYVVDATAEERERPPGRPSVNVRLKVNSGAGAAVDRQMHTRDESSQI